jgi:ankyrin repeat protein
MGNVSTVKILLSKGADPKLQDATGKTAICYAAARGYSSIVRELLDTSIGVNTRYGNLLTVLMWAAGHDDGTGSSDVEDVLTLLLARGADLNLQDNRGRTALMIAASLGHRKAIDILLSHGADKNLRDKSGKSAEDLASSDDVRQQIAAR